MLKKLVVGGIISMFVVGATVPGFAATTCPKTSTNNVAYYTQIIKNCKKNNPQLAQILSQQQKKCNKNNVSNQDIQSILNKILSSNTNATKRNCPLSNLSF